MAISLKHSFTNPKADGGDTTITRPSDWNAEHVLTMGTGFVLGRSTAGTGAVEEISGSALRTISGAQASDADLTAIAALTGTGIARRTGTDTWALLEYVVPTSFTPTLTYATPGDLSVAYGTQYGSYVRIGNRIFYTLYLDATPTFTTASGAVRLAGLPVTSAAGTVGVNYPAAIGTLGLGTWPAAGTGSNILAAFVNRSANYIQLASSSSAGAILTTGHVTSGAQFLITLDGSYPV